MSAGADSAVNVLKASRGNAFAIQAGPLTPDGVDLLVDTTIKEYGGVNILSTPLLSAEFLRTQPICRAAAGR